MSIKKSQKYNICWSDSPLNHSHKSWVRITMLQLNFSISQIPVYDLACLSASYLSTYDHNNAYDNRNVTVIPKLLNLIPLLRANLKFSIRD